MSWAWEMLDSRKKIAKDLSDGKMQLIKLPMPVVHENPSVRGGRVGWRNMQLAKTLPSLYLECANKINIF